MRASSFVAYTGRYRGFPADARLLLAASVLTGATFGLFAINFVPYLADLGLGGPSIGWILAVASAMSGAYGLAIAVLASVVGRRIAFLVSVGLASLGLAALVTLPGQGLLVGAALYLSGQQGVLVLEPALLRERSRADQRDELFAAHFAIVNAMSALGAIAVGITFLLFGPATSAPGSAYRVILVVLAVTSLAAAALAGRLADDRRSTLRARRIARASTTGSFSLPFRRLGRLLLPWTLIAIGSGQVMPYLSYYLGVKFGLGGAPINLVFGVVAAGATVAILLQPLLATRVGRVRSVVLVQALSVPLLLVIGFGPLVVVIAALVVRSALMEAGHPIYNLSVMEAVPPGLRPIVSSLHLLLLAAGVSLGSIWFALLQERLGFDGAFSVAWITTAALYATALVLMPWALQPVFVTRPRP